MEKRQIGAHGPMVSALGLGCMGMSMSYGSSDDAQSIKVIHKALELGITLLDTADRYGWGHNEELIAKAIKGRQEQVVLATKVGFSKDKKMDEAQYGLDGSPRYIKKACEASLKRLNIEAIDLYYLHRVDPKVPIEDSIGALGDLVQAGKIKHIGISEVTSATIRRAAKIHPITAVQTEYSLWERSPEKEIIPTCQELGIGLIAYSPLGRGFLTGTITRMAQLEENDFRHLLPRFQDKNFSFNQNLVVQLNELARKKNCSLSQLALAWILKNPAKIIPIPGTKKVHYLEENSAALLLHLSQIEIQQLEQIFPINAALGDRYPEEFKREA